MANLPSSCQRTSVFLCFPSVVPHQRGGDQRTPGRTWDLQDYVTKLCESLAPAINRGRVQAVRWAPPGTPRTHVGGIFIPFDYVMAMVLFA